MVAAAVLLLGSSATADQPINPPIADGDVLELRAGDYLWTGSTHHLDGALTGSLGIQFWVRPTDFPEAPFQHRVIVAKPGSYLVSLQRLVEFGRDVTGRIPVPRSYIVLGVYRWTEDGIDADMMWQPRVAAGEWTHFHLLLRATRGGLSSQVAINGERRSNGFSSPHPDRLFNRSSSRLYVGDIPPDAIYGPGDEAFPYDLLVSSPIALDELEISAGATGPVEDFDRPVTPDEPTKALWRFDEGRRVMRYADTSGKGHTLRLASLAVEVRGKAATRWAALKMRR